jgi:hypothetical protein
LILISTHSMQAIEISAAAAEPSPVPFRISSGRLPGRSPAQCRMAGSSRMPARASRSTMNPRPNPLRFQ